MPESKSSLRTALVTGGNQGLGLETCGQLAANGLRVILAARKRGAGEQAATALRKAGCDVRFTELDVSRESSVSVCAETLKREGIHIDVLVNNAGIYPQGGALEITTAGLMEALTVNFLGAFWCAKAWLPGMLAAGYGRVVNVSTGMGSFADGLEGPAAYAISKAALNALTVKLAQDVSGDVKVNAVCPGWVRTNMGGPNAERGIEEGADTIVWAALLPKDGPNGGFFRDRKKAEW